ncbi:MAG: nicotinate-nucleotide adenylyltransferase [bacterium]|nr:nicotinate-nucleotide adenylyltransferase [bacterium]
MAERVGLLGGSFNPIHFGHLIIARSVLETLELSRVIFLPSATPPHKENEVLVPPQHRAEMVRLAIAGEKRFEFSDYDLCREGPSYTIDTVGHLQSTLGDGTELYWIIGADWLMELGTWRRSEELVEACTVVTAARPGWERPDLSGLAPKLSEVQIAKLGEHILDSPQIDISATDIRARVAAGRSIRYLVPESVRYYIEMLRLYG